MKGPWAKSTNVNCQGLAHLTCPWPYLRWSTSEAGVLERVSSSVLTNGASLHWFLPLPLAAHSFGPLSSGYSTSRTSCLYSRQESRYRWWGSASGPTVHPNSSCSFNLASCWHQNTKGLHVFLNVRLTSVQFLIQSWEGDGFCIWRHVQASLSLWAEQTIYPQSWSELHFHTEGAVEFASFSKLMIGTTVEIAPNSTVRCLIRESTKLLS